jgi:DNA-binding transcriptional LysR family regulator
VPFVWASSARNPAGKGWTSADLENHRGIFYTNRGAADWRFSGPKSTAIVRAQVGLRVNNGDMMRDAATAGLGIALVATFIAGAAMEAGALTTLDVGAELEGASV